MKRFFNYLALTLAGLLSLLLAAWLTLLMCFNPNDFKQTIIDVVQEKTGRTLTLDGDISMAFWPMLGIDLGRVSLSEQASQKPFASVARAKVSLAMLPLLQKKLVVGTLYLDGVQATLIQHADGSSNFADLFDGDSNATFSYDIDGLIVKNSRLDYLNEASNQRIQVSDLSIKTGRIVQEQAVNLAADFFLEAQAGKLKTKVNLQTQLLYNSVNQDLSATNTRLSMQGQLGQTKFTAALLSDSIKGNSTALVAPSMTANASLNRAPHDLKMRWTLTDVIAKDSSINIANAHTELTYINGKRLLTSQFSTPVSAQLQAGRLDLAKLSGQLSLHDSLLKPAGLKGNFLVSAQADFKHGVGQSRFHFTSGPSLLSGEVVVSQAGKPKLQFKLAAQQWDLNTYLATTQKTKAIDARPGYLSALTQVDLDGQVTLEKIAYAPYQVHALHSKIKTEGNTLRATGMALKLDDSKIHGDVAMGLQSPHAYSMHLGIDKLDLNRYQSTGKSSVNQEQTAFDLAALKHINASGDIRIDQLVVGESRARNVRIVLQAQPEKLSRPKAVRRQP